jgi:dipeptidyl aminopeptidase/acylaminoacyl peptidase
MNRRRLTILFAVVLTGLASPAAAEARWSTLFAGNDLYNVLQVCRDGAKFQLAYIGYPVPPGSPEVRTRRFAAATDEQPSPTPETILADQTLTIPYNPIRIDADRLRHVAYSGTYTMLWSRPVAPGTIVNLHFDWNGSTFTATEPLYVGDCLLTDPPYETPQHATPVEVSLVPSYRQCGTGGNPSNSTHGPPDVPGGGNPDPSCTPPVPTAAVARAGPLAVASARVSALTDTVGDPAHYSSEGDALFTVNATDVRSGSATGPDYNPNPSGPDLTLTARWRITDTYNGGSLTTAATVTELDFSVPIDCNGTSEAVGAVCSGNTSANAVIPGAIKKGKGTSIQLFRVRLNDAGTDGIRGNANDTLFEQQGVRVGDGPRIVFDSNRGGNDDIYVANSDGSGVTRLTTDAGVDHDPAFSPDGQKIAFISNRDGNNFEIYVMNADGSDQRRLTNNAGVLDFRPAWSPDGMKLAYASSPGGNADIYVLEVANPANPFRLTTHAAEDSLPSWSPDGFRIAFASRRDGNGEIYVMYEGGSDQTNVTMNPADDSAPEWSPDGQKIAFDRQVAASNRDVYTMNAADGGAQTNITNHSGDDVDPVWSADGTQLAFSSTRDGNYEVYRTTAVPGGTQTNITNTPSAIDRRPDWQHGEKRSQMTVSLVPSFRQCGTAGNPGNSTHGAPLSGSSCTPPVPTASAARVGTHAVGIATISEIPGDPTSPTDDANLSFTASASDVRSGSPTGSDYNPNAGGPDLTLVARVRITDSHNGASQNSAGTLVDLDFPIAVDCASTAEASIGSLCTVATSADALVPNLVKERKDTSWQLFRLRLNDSGANGVRGDADDTLFEQQGLFVP